MPHSDTRLLHPKFARVAINLQKRLIADHQAGVTKTLFKLFETYRDPMRQLEALAKRTSKAGIFESAHQLGLAADFVPYIDGNEAIALGEKIGERVNPGWNWNSSHDWDHLTNTAKRFGLVTISWDRPHVQHPEAAAIIHKLKNIAYMT